MVLLFKGSKCSLCDEVLERDEKIVGFTAFLQPEHRLWPYSDSAMHERCFSAWPDKQEFEALYAAAEEEWRALQTPEKVEERRRAHAEVEAERARRDAEHNARIMRAVRRRGAVCPHCGSRSTAYRELNGTARLCLACLTCRRSCNADELLLG